MKILITGGAGFIGSHLSDILIKDHDVYVIDDLSTGSIENIEHLKENPRFHYVIDSITNESLLREMIDKCDVVLHLAAAVGVKLIIEKPVQTIETNIYGTELVLQYAAIKNKRVIITSTSEVYGKSHKVPFSEDDDLLLGPTHIARWSYACSKAIDEYLAHAYWNERRLPITVVRLFNTVGPRQTGVYGMVIPRFIKAALNNEDLIVHGDGSQSRCFGHVYDIAAAIAKLIDCKQAYGETINLGQPESITIKDLALKIIDKFGSSSQVKCIPLEEVYGKGFEDMKQRTPDIAKAKRMIGFNPLKKLDDIIADTAEFLKSQS